MNTSTDLQNQDALSVYRRQGIGGSLGFGKICALLIIDFVNGFADAAVLGGGNIAKSIDATATLLDVCRKAGLPVVFTRIVYQPTQTNGVFARKIPLRKALAEDNPQSAIVPQLKVEASDLIVRKTQASAFFGTDLAKYLTSCGVDTVLVAGCTTSGCVRASVIDAASHIFIPIVVGECVGDRAMVPHDANMFDLSQKNTDIFSREEVIQHVQSTNK